MAVYALGCLQQLGQGNGKGALAPPLQKRQIWMSVLWRNWLICAQGKQENDVS